MENRHRLAIGTPLSLRGCPSFPYETGTVNGIEMVWKIYEIEDFVSFNKLHLATVFTIETAARRNNRGDWAIL